MNQAPPDKRATISRARRLLIALALIAAAVTTGCDPFNSSPDHHKSPSHTVHGY